MNVTWSNSLGKSKVFWVYVEVTYMSWFGKVFQSLKKKTETFGALKITGVSRFLFLATIMEKIYETNSSFYVN